MLVATTNRKDSSMNQKLREIIQSSQGGHYITVVGYTNRYGEVSTQQVHADANYSSVHERSIKKLDELEKDTHNIKITRNAWFDAAGVEYTRKAGGRERKEVKDVITHSDVDRKTAFDKVRDGILNPKKTGPEYVGSNSAFQLEDECYLRNVLIASKTILKEGVYPITCQNRVNAIADWIRKQLPIGEYRQFKLNSTSCQSVSASGKQFVF